MSNLLIPTVDVQAARAVGAASGFPVLKNYADHDDIRQFAVSVLTPLIAQTRQDRAELELEWQALRKMVMLKHDENQRYKGKSNAYLPVYKRSEQTQVSMLSSGLFPSDDYLDVADRAEGSSERAKAVKTYLQWEFERVAHVRAKLKPFLRQFIRYGNSVLKYWYHKETRYEGRVSPQDQLLAVLGQGPVGSFKPVCVDGLRVSSRSIFYWYVYPNTAESLDDATMVFEDMDVPKQHIIAKGKSGEWKNIEHALSGNHVTEHSAHQAEHFADAGIQTPELFSGNDLGGVVTLTEVWTYMPLPDPDQYLEGEKVGTPVPVRLVLAGSTVLRATRNPLWTQKPPYLVARANVDPGLFYGDGVGRASKDTQYLANDFANQTNDCGMYGLNPIVKANPALMAGPMRPLAPGVTYFMTDINQGMAFDRPPIEQVNMGLTMLQTLIGMNQDFGGTPPILQGSAAGRVAKTATGAQILQKNASVPLQDIVEDLELDVLVPLMHATWVLAQQFREQPVLARVAGMQLQVSPSDLAIDPEFRWLASSQAANSQQRAQQVISFLQVMPQLVPLLQQSGKMFDPEPLLRKLHNDGFGFRGFEQVVRPLPPAPAMPGSPDAGGAPGESGSLPMDGGDRVRSAVEQVGGEYADVAPGEGEAFMEVREAADDIAGDMGSI